MRNGFDPKTFNGVKTATEADAYVVGAKMGARIMLTLTERGATPEQAIQTADALFDLAYEEGGWEINDD